MHAEKDSFRRRIGADSVQILRRQLNLGADLVPIRCLFLGAPENRRKIGADYDLRSGWEQIHVHVCIQFS